MALLRNSIQLRPLCSASPLGAQGTSFVKSMAVAAGCNALLQHCGCFLLQQPTARCYARQTFQKPVCTARNGLLLQTQGASLQQRSTWPPRLVSFSITSSSACRVRTYASRHDSDSNDENVDTNSRDGVEPIKRPTPGAKYSSDAAGGKDESSQQGEQQPKTYRELMAEWFYLREQDLRNLAAEGQLQIRDFLADPSLRVFGREVDLSKPVSYVREFDLGRFPGSFSRVAELTAWYRDRQPSESEQGERSDQVGVQTEEGQEHPAAVAFRNGGPAALGFGFSAGGLLFAYYVGVAFGLHDLGVITRDTRLAGASAGSLIAACYHSGLPEDLIVKACWELARDCRDNGTRGRLGPVLRNFLQDLLPEDIHERCRDKVYVAVTRVFPRPTPQLVTDFQSKEDLISALMTSCHIPWWFDKRVWTTFRGQYSYDGGLTNFIPVPPADHGVRVCCFAAKQMSSVYPIQISPDSFTDWEHNMTQMVAWAFEPAEEQILEQFLEKGRADAKAWAEETGVLPLVSKEWQPDPQEVEREGQQKSEIASAA